MRTVDITDVHHCPAQVHVRENCLGVDPKSIAEVTVLHAENLNKTSIALTT